MRLGVALAYRLPDLDAASCNKSTRVLPIAGGLKGLLAALLLFRKVYFNAMCAVPGTSSLSVTPSMCIPLLSNASASVTGYKACVVWSLNGS